jgi:hypothetical protein
MVIHATGAPQNRSSTDSRECAAVVALEEHGFSVEVVSDLDGAREA